MCWTVPAHREHEVFSDSEAYVRVTTFVWKHEDSPTGKLPA